MYAGKIKVPILGQEYIISKYYTKSRKNPEIPYWKTNRFFSNIFIDFVDFGKILNLKSVQNTLKNNHISLT